MSRRRSQPAPPKSNPLIPVAVLFASMFVLGLIFFFRSAPTSAASPAPPPPPVAAAPAPSVDPNDVESFVRVGNVYYDRKDYAKAIELYGMYLKVKPANSDVRTDMATAMWYSGDPDRAIREFKTALQFQPKHRQAMWNLGIVEWQGKKNYDAALDAWNKLLAAYPNDPQRAHVEQSIKEVEVEQLRATVQK